jgi:hypothetical protein
LVRACFEKAFQRDLTERMVRELSARNPVQQIRFLNRYLRQHRLLSAEPASRSAPVPKAWRGRLTNRPPRSISLSEVEDAYYFDHPEHTRHEAKLLELTRDVEFGAALARALARAEIPGEAELLEAVGEALTALPTLGAKPKPVWAALCNFWKEIGTGNSKRRVRANLLRELLKESFELNGTALRRFVAAALREHLQQWLRHCPELGCFRAARLTGRNIRDEITRLAGDDQELARCFRQIHRATRHNRDVVGALQDFFFHGLPAQDLRTRPGLLAKLMPALERDVSLLVKFLFQRKAKDKLGFIPQALISDAPGSQFRRKLAIHQTWPGRVRLKRKGHKDAELAEQVDQRAGVSPEVIAKPGYTAAAERLRERQGLTYPR